MIRVLFVIGGLAMVFACLALIGLVGTAAQDVAQRAIAETPDDGQRVTAVCVGLNIGSCRTSQESTSTARPADGGGGNPWPWVLMATAALCPVVLAVAVVIGGREVTR